jgi:hypothetical protein
LNAKTIITAIGTIRYRMKTVVYVGRMNRVQRLLEGVLGGEVVWLRSSSATEARAAGLRGAGYWLIPTPPPP